ncbi:lysophospholipid acyltransferase family protein [Holospora curviuscula]|uniref:2-acyl-glycerophospho-ethanolamine acyltransferase n=1 Tax=Holospora curviuscula TaxID=1082868 RepID=A0A2S5R862_9PROT|nr:lysophospholipid acyltransferase family protein [Holospora curviuscula]PPE03490.1 2-acyl-glycerophospho-ethanolamine acyltransferase [Holospora curviuscula]
MDKKKKGFFFLDWGKCVFAHSAFYTLSFGVTVLGALTFPLICLGPVSWIHKVARWWCACLLTNARWCLGITWKTEEFPVLSPHGGLLVACAHQSVWETLVLNLLLQAPAFVLKDTLMRIPVLGWFFHRMNMIPIPRGRALSKTFLQKAQNVLEQGRPIVIFPEGRRVAFGRPVRCQRGIFFLYHKLHLPVLPLSLNSGLFWPARRFFKNSGCITIQGHHLINPGLDEDTFQRTLSKLLQEGNEVLAQKSIS